MATIQQELQQNKPFATKAMEATVSLLRTADLIRRNLAIVIEPRGITAQQYNVLRILRGAGEKGLPTLDIAERMIEQTPGITRLIDRLESKKLVSRERCPTDRRQVFCRIAPDGLALLAELEESVGAAEAAALLKLSPDQLAQLIDLLDRARGALHESITRRRALQEQVDTRKTEPRRHS